MNTPIRWGLLSTARINRRVIPAIRASARGELVAVASRRQASADSYAAEWGIPTAFGSYEAMLASDQIDAVYIALPNHLHAPWTIKALEAGKHVLCEKPFALSVAEVDAVSAACAKTGCIAAEAFMYRHHPQTEIIKKLVDSGRIGDVTYVWGMFTFSLVDTAENRNVRSIPAYGGGALWDVGIYPLSFAQYIMGGAPTHVTAAQIIGETGIDIQLTGQMTYANGAIAHIMGGFDAPFQTAARIVGTRGRIEIARPFVGVHDVPENIVLFDADGNRELIDVPQKELYLGEIEDMHNAILDGKPQRVSLAQTHAHTRTAVALYEAAATHLPVHL